MADKTVDASEKDVREFCQRIGELILWTAAIDQQLSKAIIRTCALADSPMIECIVAELGLRQKTEILNARSKHISSATWARKINKWLEKVQKVNGYRNIVAHHQVALSNGRLTLYSAQARQILRRIKNLKPTPAKTINDVNQWVEIAKKTYVQGQNVLDNLDGLTNELAKRRAW